MNGMTVNDLIRDLQVLSDKGMSEHMISLTPLEENNYIPQLPDGISLRVIRNCVVLEEV